MTGATVLQTNACSVIIHHFVAKLEIKHDNILDKQLLCRLSQCNLTLHAHSACFGCYCHVVCRLSSTGQQVKLILTFVSAAAAASVFNCFLF